MSYYLFADGKCLGVVDADQREELRYLDHLAGIDFVPVAAPVEPSVKTLAGGDSAAALGIARGLF